MPTQTGTTTFSTEGSSGLVARLQMRDAVAWQRLSDVYGPEVYGWARRAGLQDSTAADVTQEVFQAVAQQIADLRRDRPGDSFRGWLWGISQHKIADQFRRSANQPEAPGGSGFQLHLAQQAEASTTDFTPADEKARLARRALGPAHQLVSANMGCFARLLRWAF